VNNNKVETERAAADGFFNAGGLAGFV